MVGTSGSNAAGVGLVTAQRLRLACTDCWIVDGNVRNRPRPTTPSRER